MAVWGRAIFDCLVLLPKLEMPVVAVPPILILLGISAYAEARGACSFDSCLAPGFLSPNLPIRLGVAPGSFDEVAALKLF